MANPLESLAKRYREGTKQSEQLGTELGEARRMKELGREALKPSIARPEPARPVETSPADKINPAGAYGTKPGEKRLPYAEEASKPLLGSMKKGGEVKKTGAYELHKGEKVLTPAHQAKMKSAMDLAGSVLSHDTPPEPPKPPKVDRAMHIRRLDDKTFHIRHEHTMPGDHPDEEYSASDLKALLKHMNDHFGKSEKEESKAEEAKESPGVEAAEKALGMEK